jgi:hypothetical protein
MEPNALITLAKQLSALTRRELWTVILLAIGFLLMKYAPELATVAALPDLSPILFKVGMFIIVPALLRWTLRLLMPWFRAHHLYLEALKGNTAAAIGLFAYVLLLAAGWHLASLQ